MYIHLFICKIGSLHNVWSAAVKAESKSQPPLLCMEIKTQAESLNALSPRHKSQPGRNLLTTSTLTRKSLRWKADIFFCNLIFIPLHKVLFFFSFSLTDFFSFPCMIVLCRDTKTQPAVLSGPQKFRNVKELIRAFPFQQWL